MKKFVFLSIVFSFIFLDATSQDLTARERAEAMAKNEFSKTKRKKEEKNGVIKEKTRSVISTPVITSELSFYHGNYVYSDLNYKLEIRKDKDNSLMATLSIPNQPDIVLKDVTITDAFFQAVSQKPDGTNQQWEGVFVNKNDDGNIDFGLGMKLSEPIKLTEGLSISRIFLKKVSP